MLASPQRRPTGVNPQHRECRLRRFVMTVSRKMILPMPLSVPLSILRILTMPLITSRAMRCVRYPSSMRPFFMSYLMPMRSIVCC